MITTTTDQAPGGESGRRAIPAGTPCFYCHQRLHGAVVMWWGEGADLYLHPECTVELSIRLLRDVHEIERNRQTNITGGPSSLLQPRTAGTGG